MRALIREELYKMINRRIVKVCFWGILLCIVLVFVAAGPGDERSRIGGAEVLSGLEAIRQDRELAKEFEGELTDEKLERMAQVAEMPDYLYGEDAIFNTPVNGNYLNKFLADNGMTNGEYKDLSHYAAATEVLPLRETELGRLTDRPIYFAYIQGWKVLMTLMSMAGILMSLLVIIALSPVFAEEYVIHTAPVLLTTEHGKKRDIAAKMAAGMLFALGALGIGIGVGVVLCVSFYGAQGLNCFAGMLDYRWYTARGWMGSTSYITIGQFLLFFAGIMALGMLMLAAFMLFASAVARQIYEALMLGLVFFVLPGAVWFYLIMGNGRSHFREILWRILYCTPLYSCMNGTVCMAASGRMLMLRAGIFLGIVVPSVCLGYRRYRNHQVG